MGTETDTKEQDQLDKIKATIIMIMNGHIPANRRPLLLRLLIAVIAFVSLMIMAKSTSPGDSSFRGSTTISAMTMKMKPIPRTNAYRCPSDGPEVNYNGKMMSQRGEDKQLLHTFGFDQVCGGSYIESKLLYTLGLLVVASLCCCAYPMCPSVELSKCGTHGTVRCAVLLLFCCCPFCVMLTMEHTNMQNIQHTLTT